MKNHIHLVTGGHFDYNRPENSVYSVEDIALNLSHICRFTGSVDKLYSVAQHSVFVSLCLENWGYAKDVQMVGLMHDSVEAFLQDIPKPLKQMLPDYRKIEYKCEKAIFEKYGLQFPMEPMIKEADNAVFVLERQQLQPVVPLSQEYVNINPPLFKIVPWSSEKAQKEFIKRFKELGGEMK